MPNNWECLAFGFLNQTDSLPTEKETWRELPTKQKFAPSKEKTG